MSRQARYKSREQPGPDEALPHKELNLVCRNLSRRKRSHWERRSFQSARSERSVRQFADKNDRRSQ